VLHRKQIILRLSPKDAKKVGRPELISDDIVFVFGQHKDIFDLFTNPKETIEALANHLKISKDILNNYKYGLEKIESGLLVKEKKWTL